MGREMCVQSQTVQFGIHPFSFFFFVVVKCLIGLDLSICILYVIYKGYKSVLFLGVNYSHVRVKKKILKFFLRPLQDVHGSDNLIRKQVLKEGQA